MNADELLVLQLAVYGEQRFRMPVSQGIGLARPVVAALAPDATVEDAVKAHDEAVRTFLNGG